MVKKRILGKGGEFDIGILVNCRCVLRLNDWEVDNSLL